MFRIYTTLLLICCISQSYGQTQPTKLNLSVRYLAADDITVQSRNGGKAFLNDVDDIVPGFDVNIEFSAGHQLDNKQRHHVLIGNRQSN